MYNRELAGSIVLVEGDSWLSRRIIDHMKLYARLTGRKYYLPYSHAETLIWFDGELCTTGARPHGAEILPFDEYYRGKRYRILRPYTELDEWESTQLTEQAVTWAAKYHRPYQFFNFIAWIHNIKMNAFKQQSRAWIGPDSDRKMYCYEMAARLADVTGRWPKGKSLEVVSVYDLFENNNYVPYGRQ